MKFRFGANQFGLSDAFAGAGVSSGFGDNRVKWRRVAETGASDDVFQPTFRDGFDP